MSAQSTTGPLIKSLLFVAGTLMATMILAVSIAQTNVGDTASYRARFTDASGLRKGDSVRIAGVEIGKVDSVGVADRRVALVKFSIERDRRLPASATATIKYVNLVGQRYVELAQGTGQTGVLRPGSTIPVERTQPALDLTELFNGFQPLLQALSPNDVNKLATSIVQVFQGEGTTIDGLVATIGSLTTTVAGKDKVIDQVIGNLNIFLDTVNSRQAQVVDLVTTMSRLVSGLSADRQAIGNAVTALDDLSNTTADLLNVGREPLRKDIDQIGRLSKNLAAHSGTVEKFLKLLPVKTEAIGRLGSYGSWMNLYLCEARLEGDVSYKKYEGETQLPKPTGIPLTAKRCK
ncbi:MCE family protein [Thermomonospora umbrina]|uniref:Phospholipid/cholesterol/gamma-HCH transport system substrate-binding protein n=1 Tax=Thermomonospora umbrina TaxID=111806 RepID=A0A3D9SPH0_9ACTN|nr:MCE family protein [Thermomonospora umbrina]REE97808.1 phospholipid/cholesterol/gamma-HCH transport system substrate-binding protein [Thermomonospora umbrina]